MKLIRFSCAVGIALLLTSIQTSEVSAEGASAAGRKAILTLHNSYRNQHCAGELRWSDELAADAQRWAENC